MLTVEERHELLQLMEDASRAQKALDTCRGRGVDFALACMIELENARHAFVDAINRHTDWGIPTD